MNISTLNIYFNLGNTESKTPQPTRNARPTPSLRQNSGTALSNAVSNMFQSLLRRADAVHNGAEEMSIIFGFEPSTTNLNNILSTTELDQHINFETINGNTTIFLFRNENESISEECSICRHLLNDNDICRKINQCNHIFHQNCLDTWFNRHTTCPICRASLRP